MTLTYQDILVAVDGSKEAEWAFKKAIGIAERNSATLHLVYVVDTQTYSSVEAYDPAAAKRAEAFAKELLGNYKKEAETAGIENVNVIVAIGSPKTTIPREVAQQVKADLVVCGATGLNAIERFLIGSVSERIVRTSPCDVLVVRTEEHAEANA